MKNTGCRPTKKNVTMKRRTEFGKKKKQQKKKKKKKKIGHCVIRTHARPRYSR